MLFCGSRISRGMSGIIPAKIRKSRKITEKKRVKREDLFLIAESFMSMNLKFSEIDVNERISRQNMAKNDMLLSSKFTQAVIDVGSFRLKSHL
jgi:hypothetical protein